MKSNAFVLPVLDGKSEKLIELCRHFHGKRLEIFGSAATGAFRAESSDLDFVVDRRPAAWPLGDSFSISPIPRALLADVDLITPQSIQNPYFRRWSMPRADSSMKLEAKKLPV